MTQKQKSAVIAFLGNANHDSRVVNLILSLNSEGINTKTISFDWKTPNFRTQIGPANIYKLNKQKFSFSYYFMFFFYLIRDLLKYKANYYFAEDIYTLPVVYFFSRINKAKIFYNSRELYGHLAGLRNKGFVQKIIAKIENSFIRKVDYVLVTGEMDANYLKDAYSISNIIVLRNLPKYQKVNEKIDLRSMLQIPQEDKIILYQGVLLEGRGILKIIDTLNKINNLHFVIVGDGEFRNKFEDYANKSLAKSRIHFIGAINHNELLKYTSSADIGVTLIENISISYYYALPNKLFEYIMAGVPVFASNLPQIKNIIDSYEVGIYTDPEDEDSIAESISQMLNADKLKFYKSNCENAAKELNWDIEFNKLKEILLN